MALQPVAVVQAPSSHYNCVDGNIEQRKNAKEHSTYPCGKDYISVLATGATTKKLLCPTDSKRQCRNSKQYYTWTIETKNIPHVSS